MSSASNSGEGNNVENTTVISQKELIKIAGDKLQQQITDEVKKFTQQTLRLCSSASHGESMQIAREQVSMSGEYLQVHLKEEIAKFTHHVMGIGDVEEEFNERVRLLLQCHTMSSYITACVMENFQKINKK